MADNTTINAGVGGDTLRTDDVGGGVKVPVSKIITGGDGADGGFVGITNPFPVLLVSGSDAIGTVTNPLRISGSTGPTVGGVPISFANPMPVSGAVGILAFGSPASRTNPIPTGPVGEAASQILSGSTIGVVYHAFFDASSGSANQVVPPAGAGKRIAVLSAQVMTSAATGLRFISTGSAGAITNIAAFNACPANGGYILPHNPHGWCKTVANEGLNMQVFATAQVGITITWAIFNNP